MKPITKSQASLFHAIATKSFVMFAFSCRYVSVINLNSQ